VAPAKVALEEGLRLTTRELAVLGLLAAGKSNREIADALGISDSTVKIHVRHVFAKLEVTSRTKAIVTAARWRLVRID
jgi:DNA-binding NarL/FixJ family response regulator